MAGLSFECDWRYAMNISAERRSRTGYLMSWSGVGGLSLATDITVRNPFSSTGAEVLKGKEVKCVGVFDRFSFGGEKEDPIRIAAYVSTANAASLRAKLASGISTTKLKFSFAVCDYDLETKRWFEAGIVQGNAKASCVVDTMDGRLQLFVDAVPTRIDPSIDLTLCRMEFQAAPSPKEAAKLRFATGANEKVVKEWGGA